MELHSEPLVMKPGIPVEEVLLQLQWLVLVLVPEPVLALALELKSRRALLGLMQALAQVKLQVRPLAPAASTTASSPSVRAPGSSRCSPSCGSARTG